MSAAVSHIGINLTTYVFPFGKIFRRIKIYDPRLTTPHCWTRHIFSLPISAEPLPLRTNVRSKTTPTMDGNESFLASFMKFGPDLNLFSVTYSSVY